MAIKTAQVTHFQIEGDRVACGNKREGIALTVDYRDVSCKACANSRVMQATVRGELGGDVEDEHEASYEDETDDSKLTPYAELVTRDDVEGPTLPQEFQDRLLTGTARYEGSYKGARYAAVQVANGSIRVTKLEADAFDSAEMSRVIGTVYASRGPAGYAIAAAVLDALGKPKTPRAFAELKLVSGTEQKATASRARKRGFFTKSPVNHVPAGHSRWFCSACMASFVVEGNDEPTSCNEGHMAADFNAPTSEEAATA